MYMNNVNPLCYDEWLHSHNHIYMYHIYIIHVFTTCISRFVAGTKLRLGLYRSTSTGQWYWELHNGSYEKATYIRGHPNHAYNSYSRILITGTDDWSRVNILSKHTVSCSDNSKYIYEIIAFFYIYIYILYGSNEVTSGFEPPGMSISRLTNRICVPIIVTRFLHSISIKEDAIVPNKLFGKNDSWTKLYTCNR